MVNTVVDVNNLDVTALKVLFYDQVVLLNQIQANINMIQAEIAKREQENNKTSINKDGQ